MADATDANFELVRGAFEAAMREHYPHWAFTSDGCGGYHNERTELAWQGWMACFLRMTAAGVTDALPFNRDYVHAYLQEALTDAVGGAVDPEVQRFMTWLTAGVAEAPAAAGPLQQMAAGIEALDEGHDPLCMAVLRGKACTCGVAPSDDTEARIQRSRERAAGPAGDPR